jgi:hypothetical protein
VKQYLLDEKSKTGRSKIPSLISISGFFIVFQRFILGFNITTGERVRGLLFPLNDALLFFYFSVHLQVCICPLESSSLDMPLIIGKGPEREKMEVTQRQFTLGTKPCSKNTMQ